VHRPIDSAIAAIADSQHGNITREQLLALGVDDKKIGYRVKAGRLHRVHRGIYAVGRPPRTALERAAAAVLACGPGAALSHFSALALWRLAQRWPTSFEVTITDDRRPRGIRVHRCDGLARRDFRRHDGIRVTSPARTLLDCAPYLSDRRLARAVNAARQSRNLRLTELADVIERFPAHRGARRLGVLLDARGGPTRSEWEDAFPAFCRRFGLPEPVMAARVAGYEVDALFPSEKVIVELDSWGFHSSRESFESDRERDASTLAASHVTVRLTWERMHRRGAIEAARLQQILRDRRPRAA
jgi:predicted transcriptional regulator of viral defense system